VALGPVSALAEPRFVEGCECIAASYPSSVTKEGCFRLSISQLKRGRFTPITEYLTVYQYVRLISLDPNLVRLLLRDSRQDSKPSISAGLRRNASLEKETIVIE
jgi:hypothetical protein